MNAASNLAKASAVVGLLWLLGGVNPCWGETHGTEPPGSATRVTQPGEQGQPADVRRVLVHFNLLGPGVTDASLTQLTTRLIEDFAPWSVELVFSWERDLRDRPRVVKRIADVASVATTMGQGSAETLHVYVADLRIDEDGNGVPDFTAAPLVVRRDDGSTAPGGVMIDRSIANPHSAGLTYQLGLALGLWESPDDAACQRLQRRRKPTAVVDQQHRAAPIVIDAREER